MAHLPDAVHDLFALQHGMIATTQLRSFMSQEHVERFEEGGSIVGFVRGVYRSPSWPVDELSRCAAVCLGRPYVVDRRPDRRTNLRVSATAERSAGARTDATGSQAGTGQVGVRLQDGRHPRAGRRPASRRDPDHQPSPHRARSRPVRRSRRSSLDHRTGNARRPPIGSRDDGRRNRLRFTAAPVARHIPAPVRPSRTWCGLPSPTRRSESAPLCVTAGIDGLVRQFEIDLPGYGPARFDLAVPALRWAIEVDVHPDHRQTIGKQRDDRRDVAARAIGWSTSRISREQYETEFQTTIRRLSLLHRDSCRLNHRRRCDDPEVQGVSLTGAIDRTSPSLGRDFSRRCR